MELAGKSILVVDDDELLRERLARALVRRGLSVRAAEGADEALELAAASAPDLAVLDLKMPGRSGLELLPELLRVSPKTKVVILTGYGSITNAVDAIHAGAVNYVTKPADADQVLEAFRRGSAADTPRPRPEDLHAPSLAEAEWNHIQQALADCGGNITRAAEHLGIPRRTLQRKLKKLAP
ncbi:Photosynthetic apparatus regulatory protein RegA [Pirellulimonas nuda]|uniref:Photosynthetic apparatus regulatory protein RegA n=2 Tax=Pirellulimonas nuda TaxID=2528009 RepID=A0A518DET9_9BACT|nr:Photosynthetic apparatus regulatory protein RegA [Pirellulimonas nuda]